VGLISQRFADENDVKYGSCGMRVATSLGGTGSVVGRVVDPLYAVLNENSTAACSTFSPAAKQFLVVKGCRRDV